MKLHTHVAISHAREQLLMMQIREVTSPPYHTWCITIGEILVLLFRKMSHDNQIILCLLCFLDDKITQGWCCFVAKLKKKGGEKKLDQLCRRWEHTDITQLVGFVHSSSIMPSPKTNFSPAASALCAKPAHRFG